MKPRLPKQDSLWQPLVKCVSAEAEATLPESRGREGAERAPGSSPLRTDGETRVREQEALVQSRTARAPSATPAPVRPRCLAATAKASRLENPSTVSTWAYVLEIHEHIFPFFFFFLIFQSNCLKCKHLLFHSILEESF